MTNTYQGEQDRRRGTRFSEGFFGHQGGSTPYFFSCLFLLSLTALAPPLSPFRRIFHRPPQLFIFLLSINQSGSSPSTHCAFAEDGGDSLIGRISSRSPVHIYRVAHHHFPCQRAGSFKVLRNFLKHREGGRGGSVISQGHHSSRTNRFRYGLRPSLLALLHSAPLQG